LFADLRRRLDSQTSFPHPTWSQHRDQRARREQLLHLLNLGNPPHERGREAWQRMEQDLARSTSWASRSRSAERVNAPVRGSMGKESWSIEPSIS